jgi:hypothetical protein
MKKSSHSSSKGVKRQAGLERRYRHKLAEIHTEIDRTLALLSPAEAERLEIPVILATRRDRRVMALADAVIRCWETDCPDALLELKAELVGTRVALREARRMVRERTACR